MKKFNFPPMWVFVLHSAIAMITFIAIFTVYVSNSEPILIKEEPGRADELGRAMVNQWMRECLDDAQVIVDQLTLVEDSDLYRTSSGQFAK